MVRSQGWSVPRVNVTPEAYRPRYLFSLLVGLRRSLASIPIRTRPGWDIFFVLAFPGPQRFSMEEDSLGQTTPPK